MFDRVVGTILESLQNGRIMQGAPGFNLLQRVERMTIQLHTIPELRNVFKDFELLENYWPGKYFDNLGPWLFFFF